MENIKEEIVKDLEKVNNLNELNDVKVKYLGKSGVITELQSKIREAEDKKAYGMYVNEIKTYFNEAFTKKNNEINNKIINEKLEGEKIDVTLPGVSIKCGAPNILEKTIEEVEQLFMSLGFDVVDGPEIEEDKYNFELLNIPKGHPARDAQDTFYIVNDEVLLRSQTSPVQARTMLKGNGETPIRMICPGKTSETHYNKLASLNLEDYVLVSINFEYKLHPVDYLFVGNSRRMKEIRKDLYKKVIASSNVPSGNVFAKINYSSLLNKTEYVKDNSGLMFLKLLSMCDVNSVKIIGMDGYLHKHDDNYISDDLMFVLEEDIAEQINLGVKLEIKKLKKELSIEII